MLFDVGGDTLLMVAVAVLDFVAFGVLLQVDQLGGVGDGIPSGGFVVWHLLGLWKIE